MQWLDTLQHEACGVWNKWTQTLMFGTTENEAYAANVKESPTKPKRDYWYEYFFSECVLCGAPSNYKYRVYDRPKPKNIQDRYHFDQYACSDHWL